MKNKTPRHVTIAISGFTSQESDQKEGWKDLIRYLEQTSVATYAVKWEAKTEEQLKSEALKAAAAFGLDLASILSPARKMTRFAWLLFGGK